MKKLFASIFSLLLLLSACTPTPADNYQLFSDLNVTPNQTISSPFKITGEAKGILFFEGTFPIRLINQEGKEIAVARAEAQSNWMTEDFVPFIATLTFNSGTSPSGILYFEQDNPSGNPETLVPYEVPIKFAP